MVFEYKVVSIPRSLSILEKNLMKKNVTGDQIVAEYLEEQVNSMARDGWEYVRSEQMSLTVNPGCLAGLIGAKAQTTTYSVAVFRKAA
jgi:hypothetical protein